MYGYQDSSEVAPGSAGGKLGLNKGLVTKFEFNPNSGQEGAAGDGIDFTVKVGEREYRKRFFPVSKVFRKGGGELTDPNSQEYKDAKALATKLLNAELTSIVEAFVDEATVKEALSVPIASFKDFSTILERLIKSTHKWNETEVDVFLQYQWQPSGENTRTFLQLPSNVKQGIYIVKAVPGEFKTERTSSHLRFVNAEGGIHPFKRGQWFVESAFANPTIMEEETSEAGEGTSATSGDW